MSSFVQLEATVQEATAKIDGIGMGGPASSGGAAAPKALGADDGSVLADMMAAKFAPIASVLGAVAETMGDVRRDPLTNQVQSGPSKFTGASKKRAPEPFIKPTYTEMKQQAKQVGVVASKFGKLDAKALAAGRSASNDPFKRKRDVDLLERSNITKMGMQSSIRGMTLQEKIVRGLVPQELVAQLNGARQELEKPSLEVLENSLETNDARAKQRLQNTAPSFQQTLKMSAPGMG